MSEAEFQTLLASLKEIASDFEEDHRDTTFFIIPNATLKVARLRSKERAKIAYKSGDIVRSKGQTEIEIDIPYENYDSAIAMFKMLGLNTTQTTQQIRFNLMVQDVEIAMKWSEDWGYHFEVEKMVKREADVDMAQRQLADFCKEHGLTPLSDEEFEEFRISIDANHASKATEALEIPQSL